MRWHLILCYSGLQAPSCSCTSPQCSACDEHYGKRGVELNEARLRMATLPAGAEVMPTALLPHCRPFHRSGHVKLRAAYGSHARF